MKRPRGTCPLCGQEVPLCKDGSTASHVIGTGPYAPGENRPYCTRWSAKAHRNQEAEKAARAAYFGAKP